MVQDFSAHFVPGVMWQQLFLPKLKAPRKGFFSAVFLRNFGPDRFKCGVRAQVGAKPIKNYEGSCDHIERVFQMAELSAGVGGFGADAFKQKSDGPVRMDFSRNAIGDPVSWFSDVTIAAFFRGGFESGKLVAPIAVILGFGQKPFGAERVKETGQIGL